MVSFYFLSGQPSRHSVRGFPIKIFVHSFVPHPRHVAGLLSSRCLFRNNTRCPIYRVFILSSPRARQLNRIECQHPPGYPVIAAVLRAAETETYCRTSHFRVAGRE
jgi:hypothetical protein